MLNLDTHILIRALQGSLSAWEQGVLRGDSEWCISAIVLWEIKKLHQCERINFGLDYPPLARSLKRVNVLAVDYFVCSALEWLDFQSDPADEIIAATSLAYGIPLLTRDTRILSSKKVEFP